METKRIEFVDLAKGLCILLVVIFHLDTTFKCNIPYLQMSSSFRMPLYFILSGLFFKDYGGFKSFFVKKTNKLAIPYAFFYVFNILLFPFILYLLFPSIYSQPTIGKEYFLCAIYEKSNQMPNAIWFLLCLFILNLIFYVVFVFSKQLVAVFKVTRNPTNYFIASLIIISVFLGCIGYYLGVSSINLNLYIDSALTVVPFFCFGYLLRKYTNLLYINKYDKYNFIFIIISIILIRLLYGYLSYKSNEYHISLFNLYFTGMIGSVSVLYIAKYIKRMPIVSYIGRYSIITLCTHQQIIIFMRVFFKTVNIGIGSISQLVITFAVIVILEKYVLIPFMIKFMPHVTAQKDVLKLV